jgi:signal transduction histidine kinase
MEKVSNERLLAELKKRFDRNDEVMHDQRRLLRQLEKINQRLIHSEQIQSRFLSNIRNEINNPLTAILGMSRQLMTGLPDKTKYEKTASMIFSESFRLNFQLQNIFLAAELEAGQAQPYVMDVHVNKLIEYTLENFSHLINQKNLTVTINSELSQQSTFRTDPEKLEVILSNLIINAIEFTTAPGEIAISTQQQNDGTLSITLKDTGEGIAEENINVIFDRFVQLNNGSTKNHPGHGLGLSVVHSMLELLGGKVEVVSRVNKGTAFLITIPPSPDTTPAKGDSHDGNEFLFDSDAEQIL